MTTETWATAVSTWDTRTDHWTVPDVTTSIRPTGLVPRDAGFNLVNNTVTAAIALAGPRPSDINLRWRVEPAPVGPLSTVRAAVVNLKFIVTAVTVPGMTQPPANVNWRYFAIPAPVGGMVPRDADVNLRWRVEPTPVGPLGITRLATAGNFTVTGDTTTTGRFGGPFVTTRAFIQTGDWEETVKIRWIEILAEDRVITVAAEDRDITVGAEDRTITIRK